MEQFFLFPAILERFHSVILAIPESFYFIKFFFANPNLTLSLQFWNYFLFLYILIASLGWFPHLVLAILVLFYSYNSVENFGVI